MIPITVGVTGHRDLRPEETRPLQDQVRSKLKEMKGEYLHSPLRLLCSLSSGWDLLCAGIALEEGLSLLCALPLPPDEYIKDFEGQGLAQLEHALALAEASFQVPATEPLPEAPSRDFWYRQAGIFVARHCHVLMALWDGTPAQENGCGTAETVGFMRHGLGGFRAEPGGAVLHLQAGRLSNNTHSDIAFHLLEDKPGMLKETLRFTDSFNGEGLPAAQACPLAPLDVLERSGPVCRELHNLYLRADGLSGQYRDKYLGIMKGLAVFSAAMVLCFLLYDEFAANLFLPLYGVFLLLSALILGLSRRQGYHAKYLQYRVLAEAMRVQFFLSAAGIKHNISASFTWTQKQNSSWVMSALSSILTLPSFTLVTRKELKRYWISEQLAYHEKAIKREGGRRRVSSKTSKTMMVLSVSLFFTALLMEFMFGRVMAKEIPVDALRPFLLMREGEQVTWSAIIKIFLGTASAMTLFLSTYYGKLSLDRKVMDYEKMAALYQQAGVYFDKNACKDEQLFLNLAREEIIESGNWYSYSLDNMPGMNL